MATATVTSKGQITIPIEVRQALGISAGDRVEFIERDKGEFTVRTRKGSIFDAQGIIDKPKKPVSIEEMNRAIALMGSRKRP